MRVALDTTFSVGEELYIIDEDTRLSQDGKKLWDVKRNLGGPIRGKVLEILVYCKEDRVEEHYILGSGVDRVVSRDRLFRTEKEALEMCTHLNQVTMEELLEERIVVA